jgi:hypothetical protein
MRWNEPVARTVPAAEAAQNGSAPEKPLSMPCLPLYGIVGSLVRFVQRQRPGQTQIPQARHLAAESPRATLTLEGDRCGAGNVPGGPGSVDQAIDRGSDQP